MRALAVILGLVIFPLGGCGGGGGGGSDDGDLSVLAPVSVSSALSFEILEASGQHTCGVAIDGTTYCWGANEYGELGSSSPIGNCSDVPCTGTPQKIDANTVFIVLSGSLGTGVTCGLTEEGEAYCWGFGLGGQLGNGQQANSSTPSPVSGGFRFDSIRVAPNGNGVCGISTTGDLYCWGQLGLVYGNGQKYEGHNVPTRVDSAQGFTAFDLGEQHICGVKATGQAYCWGNNWYGQLGAGSAGGDGGLSEAATPGEVVGGHEFYSIATGSSHTCALTETGEVYCWGLGDNIGSSPGNGYQAVPKLVEGGFSFLELYAGYNHTCALTTEGEAYCWGQNYSGELGDGTRQSRNIPVKVKTEQKFVILSHRPYCGLTAQGQAYCWGSNRYGQVGQSL